jgi:hypothetical protein
MTDEQSDSAQSAATGGPDLCVFISYRRDDVPDATDRLAGSLTARFGKDQVFLDVNSIEIGAPFAEVVGDWIGRCDVVLAVIGRNWVNATDDEGRCRLESPKDYVRLEIEAGLARKVRVVPVLIHGANMPKTSEVPESLLPLLERNAIELSRAYWDLDVDKLIAALTRERAPGPPARARDRPRSSAPRPVSDATKRVQQPEPRSEAAPPAETVQPTAASPPRQTAPPERTAAPRQAAPRPETARTSPTARPPETAGPKPVSPAAGRRSRWPALAVGAGLIAVLAVAAVILIGGGSSGSAWKPLESLPQPLAGAGATTYRGEIWVAGGCSNPRGGCGDTSKWVTSVYHYDPRAGTWTAGPSLPQARNHTALVSNGSQLFAIGGFGPGGAPVSTVLRLDSPTGQWQQDPRSLPSARGAGAAVWDGKRIVFAGGADSANAPAADVWALGTGGWASIGQLQEARKHLAGATDGSGTSWFVGGANTAGAASGAVDVVTSAGVHPGPAVSPVKGAAAVPTSPGFCAIGGSTDPGPTGEVQCEPHSSAPALSPSRDYLAAVAFGNRIYAIGGFTSAHVGGIATVEAIPADLLR